MSRNKRKRQKTATLSPQTEPGQVTGGIRYVPFPARPAGVRVTEDTALTCAAVWACVRVISESLATLPLRVHRKLPNGRGREVAEGNDVDWLLHVQANEETSAFLFRETMIAHALTWGNGYAEIERDRAGRPLWLWQLTPDRVSPDRDTRGRLIYEVWNPGEANSVLPAADVLHLKGLGFDGLVGYSVIRMAARSIALGMAADEFASTYFANDSTPGGILEHPLKLSPEATANIRESWQTMHGGPRNRRRVAVLEEGMKWHQTGLPPEDSQLLESREYSTTDVARWFRVPPHKIGDLTRATFSNIESQEIEFVADTLLPWATRYEQELNIKLFGRVNRGTLVCKHNFNGRLRADSAARGTYYTQMLDRGVLSINDVLTLEDQNPIGADGDKRFVPLNMQLLENAGEEPPEPAPGPPPAAPPGMPGMPPEAPMPPVDSQAETPAETPASDLRAALMPVLVDACARVLRRETNGLASPKVARGSEAQREGWRVEHLAYACEAVRSGVSALAALLGAGQDAVSAAVNTWVANYDCDLSRRMVNADLGATADPAAYAERLAGMVEGVVCSPPINHQTPVLEEDNLPDVSLGTLGDPDYHPFRSPPTIRHPYRR